MIEIYASSYVELLFSAFLYLVAASSIVKVFFSILLLGKFSRNFPFIFKLLAANFLGSTLFFTVMYIQIFHFKDLLFFIYSLSYIIYIVVYALIFFACMVSVEYFTYKYVFFKGSFGRGDLLALLLLLNSIAYIIIYELGLLIPFGGL